MRGRWRRKKSKRRNKDERKKEEDGERKRRMKRRRRRKGGGRTKRDVKGRGGHRGGGAARLRRRRSSRKKRRKEQDTQTDRSRSLRRRLAAAAAEHRSSTAGRTPGAMAAEDSRSTACTGSSLLQPVSELTNLPLDQVRPAETPSCGAETGRWLSHTPRYMRHARPQRDEESGSDRRSHRGGLGGPAGRSGPVLMG